eukprot:gene30188-35175_t
MSAGETVTLDEAKQKLQQCIRHQQVLLDLSDQGLQPPFLSGLLDHISNMPATAKPTHSITVDLTWNRLGNIQEEHLMLLCDTLCDNPWLRVRLGAEVMVPYVMAALRQKEMTDMLDTQLIVDRPWEHPSARKLAESMAGLQRSTAAMTAGVQRTTATLSELATKWDKALGGFQGHIKKTATALESKLVQAVRGQLDDSQVLGLSYNWQEVQQSMPGDVDGLVVGWLCGDSRQQVVVVCEAKYDMKKEWKDAADQVQQNKTRLLDIWDADANAGQCGPMQLHTPPCRPRQANAGQCRPMRPMQANAPNDDSWKSPACSPGDARSSCQACFHGDETCQHASISPKL